MSFLKTDYDYIRFERIDSKNKTAAYVCLNNKSDGQLGYIRWYGAWRQYCFFTGLPAVFSASCLKDIQDFLEQLKKENT